MTIGEIIKNYRSNNKMTMQEFAERTKLSKAYISMLEKGYHPQNNKPITPTLTTLSKIAQGMSINLNDLLEKLDGEQVVNLKPDINSTDSIESDESPSIKSIVGVRIPILGEIVAGIPLDAYQEILDYEEIPAALASQGEFFALKVKGDSMSPRISDGDIVICKQQSDIESGDIAVVTINGDTATLKKVIKHSTGITLVALNTAVFQPQFFTNEEVISLPITIQGKVIELRAKF